MAEGGAGGKEVGRISIRVVPDLEGFRTKLKEELDALEKRIVTIKFDANTDLLRAQVKAATEGLDDAKVKVKTEFDRKGDLVHDLDAAMEDAGGRAKAIEPKIKPKIDEADFQAQIRAVKAQAKLSDTKLNIDFDDKKAESKLEAEIGKLKAIAKAQSINLRVGEDRKSGFLSDLMGRGGGGGGRNGGSSKGFDFLPNIAGLGGVPSMLLIVGALSLLAPALALLSTALVSLPALITAVAAPIGVLALGFGGIKKALEDSGIMTDTKGKKGKDKIGLGTFLKQIQDSVSNVFEKGLTPLFKQMFDAFSGNIPILARGLPFIAQGLVDFATGVTRSLSSVPNLQMLDRLTNSIGTMMTNLTPGITSFSNAMIGLVTNVGDHLPGLGTVMSGWADRFQNWVSAMSKPKQDWFKQDIPNSSVLDSAVTNMKPVLESVVNFVGKLTDAGLKLAANPDMAANIKKTVDGLTNLAIEALPGLNTAFGKLAGILSQFGLNTRSLNDPSNSGGKFWGKDTGDKGDGNGSGFRIPGMKGRDGSWFGPDTKSWIPKILRPDGADQILSNLASLFRSPSWGSGDANATPDPFNPGRPAVPQPVAPQSADGGAGGLGSKVADQLQGVKGAVGPALAGIADGSDKVWDKLVEATKAAGVAVVGQVQAWVGQIQSALAGLGPAGAAAGQALGTGMAGGIAASAPSVIAAATALAQGAENAAKVHLGIHSPSKVFHGIGKGIAQGLANGIDANADSAVSSARNLAHGTIKMAADATNRRISPFDDQHAADLYKPGWNYQKFWDAGPGGGWNTFPNGKDGHDKIPAVGPNGKDPDSTRIRWPWGGGSNTDEGSDKGKDTFYLPSELPSIATSFKHGSSLAKGFGNGISSGSAGVSSAALGMAQSATGTVKDALGIKSPSTVYYTIGQNTAQGFQNGLENGFQGVLDSAHSLAQQVTDAISGNNIGGGAGKQLAAQVQDQLKAITVEQDQLRAQKDGTADKGQQKAIQGQMDQLNIAKDQLKAQSSQLGYSEKYGDSEANTTKQQAEQLDLQEQQLKAQYDATTDKGKRQDLKSQMDQIKAQKDALKLQGGDKDNSKTDAITQGLGQSVNKMADIGKNFAMANVNQFENDIGISGKGAIPTIANIGLDWATSTLSNMASGLIGGKGGGATHIHVNSIDEGLAAKQTVENRQALTHSAGR